ncbi:MAG: hypothetical protein SWY16_14995 [Cyanobacteriota bacterium]|nr:hypothetical protein [Cyanobacteriota bacterium]
MSQSSSGESLKPALRVALGSLDVQLDAELARYRRLSKATKPYRKSTISTPPTPSDGVTIAQGVLPESPLPVPEERPTVPEAEPATPIVDAIEPETPAIPPTPATPTTPELPPMVVQPAASAPTPASTNSVASLPPLDPPAPSPIADVPTPEPTIAPPPIAAGTTPDPTAPEPKDYLESSEELLKTTGDPAVENERSGGLMGILGIGSVLLFLLATATLGYAIFRPASVARFLGRSPDSETANAPATEEAPQETEELPTSPDLSREEFKDLELDNLGSVNPSPSPVPQTAPTPVPTAAPTPTPGSTSTLDNLDRVLDPNADPSEANPSPADPTATPSPEASPNSEEAETPKPPVDEDDRYYNFHFVVVEYNPQNWDKVRETVPDAYLRQFPVGERIQVGAFDTQEEAQQLLDALQAGGVNATVYQPE